MSVAADGPRESASVPLDGRTIVLLLIICAGAALFRFIGLGWGAPYFHFHIDEHFVFAGADMLRRSLREASMSAKFFMYGPLPMWMLDAVVTVYGHLAHPLVLSNRHDEITYMMLGRTISATLGTACVPLAFLIARRVAGSTAGLLAALLLACSVVHLRESHFFTVDISMLFFSVLCWLFGLWIAEHGRPRDYLLAGVSLGAALACKYSAGFLVGVLFVAHLCAPGRPGRGTGVRGWVRWTARGIAPLVVAALVFAVIDPMAWQYPAKFRDDIMYWVVGPNSGRWRPIFIAQFTDVQPQLYWFTNLLWWGLGPGLEIWGLLGVVWLIVRRDRCSLVAAAFSVCYYAATAQGSAPVIRYSVPLAAGLAVAGGVLSADLFRRRRLRPVARVATGLVCLSTALYGMAYLHIYRAPDSRLAASRWLLAHVPADSKVLVEPSQNTPPMGSYLTNIDFNGDYVLWRSAQRHDYYQLYGLDTYQFLYDRGTTDSQRRQYIHDRLALADWIVMDDTFLQFYAHLPEDQYGVVKQYYRDLFADRLGFHLVKTFKVYPSLFGATIDDDRAELTFRLFDHPRVFVFERTGLPVPSN